ncbi:leukocyte receptor cluster member 8 homolog [Microplitis demolitor]|uniref:leukocyte receptor cluster member 8 homolog n=1 Tax=Microplitis demolitor TaxID=69319 RepID=UPI0004CDD8B2|nr:leukocyte receptor cluster member 8 homolog [Microplitis demolitor]
MSESEAVASQQKQQQQSQQQHFNQQFNPNPMANMVWQYPQPANMHQYQGFPNQMYPQGYNPQGQMYYYPPGMMTGYGQHFNAQQIPPQQQQQQQQNIQNNQGNKPQGLQQQPQQQQQQPQQPIQPMVLDDDADLPPLPPGPPPPTQQPSQHNNQIQPPLQNQPQMFMYYPSNYGGWGDQNDMSQFNNGQQQQVRFNPPNKKAGVGSVPSGNSGAAKKKRRKNKFVTVSQGNTNSFQANNVVTTFTPGTDIKPDSLPPLPPTEDIAALPKTVPPAIKIPDIPIVPAPTSNTAQPTSVHLSQVNSKKSTVGSINSSTNSNTSTIGAPVTGTNSNPVGDWPDSLKNYVNRCYEKCQTAVDKDQVEIILKGKITRAANDGSLWIKDWDKEPLPSIHSERMTMTIKAKNPIVKATNNSLTITMSNNLRRPGGLSTSLGARLGARLSAAGHPRPKSRTRSKSKSRSRSRSISPPSRKYRRSSSSSSNTSDRGGSHDYKSSSSKSSKKSNNRSKDSHSAKKSKKNKQPKSHFYSEFGLASGNAEELGSKEKLQQRAARFNDSISRTVVVKDDTADFDFTGLHIIGTCKDLEKPYLRLTSAPAASAVRPVSVLQSSLAHVKKRWVSEQDYRYACDQLKSIRQDLTVQGIRDSFTVHVYETHARVALERGDHEEFNQCQTQLRMLYQDVGGDNRCEFVAYRILYYIFTKNTQDLTTIMAALTKDDKKDECIKHALKVRSAWWLGNFHVFFKLYKIAPRMAAFLMDWFIARERKNALKTMIKSYRQNLAVDFIITELAFQSLDKFYEFVSDFGLIYADSERRLLDCKASSSCLGGW